MLDERLTEIIKFIKEHPDCTSKELYNHLSDTLSYATVKRLIQQLVSENYVLSSGAGKHLYSISPTYEVLHPIDLTEYFQKEIDERSIRNTYQFDLIKETLGRVKFFTEEERQFLFELQSTFRKNVSSLSETIYSKEMQRMAIDLSWKSSQIEGNTYSLLETERLLLDKETASGKTKDEAIMLLNHKVALDFIQANPDYLSTLTIHGIEDIHQLLVKELEVDRGIRRHRIGISGTNYKPLENDFQIKEALQDMCELVNARDNVFEKALLLLVLLSYIQAFSDGNKRTSRIVCNAVLLENGYCPISFRTIDPIEYKKALLLFYEQNNLSAFKKMFIEQFEFAVKNYF
ncbi:MAG: Fic family protein [Bacteroidia bacterium]|nr:Fic family protein [Bacteroidia bacterium]